MGSHAVLLIRLGHDTTLPLNRFPQAGVLLGSGHLLLVDDPLLLPLLSLLHLWRVLALLLDRDGVLNHGIRMGFGLRGVVTRLDRLIVSAPM